jgi:hypothetical protein
MEFIANEVKNLKAIFKLKGYRRYGNQLKIKHGDKWKTESNVEEFVWNFCRHPRLVNSVLPVFDNAIVNEVDMTQWFMKLNKLHECGDDVYLCEDYEACLEWLIDETHNCNYIYSADSMYKDNGNELWVESSDGEVFNGLLIFEEDIPYIQNIVVTIIIPEKNQTKEFKFTPKFIEENCEYVDESLFFLQLFPHPLPITHFDAYNITFHVKINFSEDIPYQDYNFYPIFTVCNTEFKDWIDNRTFIVRLNDIEKMLISKDNVKLMHVKQKLD